MGEKIKQQKLKQMVENEKKRIDVEKIDDSLLENKSIVSIKNRRKPTKRRKKKNIAFAELNDDNDNADNDKQQPPKRPTLSNVPSLNNSLPSPRKRAPSQNEDIRKIKEEKERIKKEKEAEIQ